MEILAAIVFGLLIGSFLNVCIVRLPEDASVISPASHCPRCEAPIRVRDNIPIVSYIVLRGRCRDCGERISARYPLVETLTAALFVALVLHGFPPRELLLNLALASALVAITFIDIDHFIIPDVITLPTILVAPGLAFVVGHISVTNSLVGILVGGGLLRLFGWLYEVVRKQEGMGLGDVKLLAMIGGVQGWEATLFTVFAGALAGSAAGIVLLAARGGRMDTAIPFGPFLALGSLVYAFAGPELVAWYFA